MIPEELLEHLEARLQPLKDFQRASADWLFKQMYKGESPHMLLADEVGLGKTVVARGLIARILIDRLRNGETEPYRVVYICSNLVIARENIEKLDPLPAGVERREPVPRLGYLCYRKYASRPDSGETQPLTLDTLTPSTSFHVSSGTGERWERAAIYAALLNDPVFHAFKEYLIYVLKGGIENVERFKGQALEVFEKQDLRDDFPDKLIKELKTRTFEYVGNTILHWLSSGGNERPSLYDVLWEVTRMVRDNIPEREYSAVLRPLLLALRRCLVDLCLEYVDADLYILDEFQRFRDLIDEDSDEEQAELAHRVFQKSSHTRILLMSATPFKPFTGVEEREDGEDHYKDFRAILKFLLRYEPGLLEDYERHRKALYRQILNIRRDQVHAIGTEDREQIEKILRSVMCRTERQSLNVSTGSGEMIVDKTDPVPFTKADIENFRQTDKIALAVSSAIGRTVPKPIEYAKSAVCPLSFLDHYQLKEKLRAHQRNWQVRRALEASSRGWLDFEPIRNYQPISATSPSTANGDVANARLRALTDISIGERGALMLWIPPSLPYYRLEEAFHDCEDFSKTLVFSSWVMVPRMISTLLSYEVERLTVGNKDSVITDKEEGERTYFAETGRRRQPGPQINYGMRTEGKKPLPANMSNFTLIYPSIVLSEMCDLVQNLKDRKSLNQLRTILAGMIRDKIDDLRLKQYVTKGGESERWYWAAPLLLDRAGTWPHEAIEEWFATLQNRQKETQSIRNEDHGSESGKEEVSAKQEHFAFLKEVFEQPESAGLGEMPEGLAEVLADLSLGSPAVLAYRSFVRMFPIENRVTQLHRAREVADEFVSLFNKPESISAVRLSYKYRSRHLPSAYWAMVSSYCASGCLQAVLDEYLHLIKDQGGTPESAWMHLVNTVNLQASVINVDSLTSFLNSEPRKMRMHYAVEFGSQRAETEEGKRRATGLREVFNSPFRPFVLATTSIGQEGLDFHRYCRRLVHWNLPSNPVDFEQREGRITRYKGLAIRQIVAHRHSAELSQQVRSNDLDVWSNLFEIANRHERLSSSRSEVTPYWHIDRNEDEPGIERVIPLFPYSSDVGRLSRIMKTLALYRLAFGQPRQVELVDHVLKNGLSPDEVAEVVKRLTVDLSPIRFNN